MTRALVLQHIRCEPPGVFSGVLARHGIAIETVELDEGGQLPDWRDADLIVAMGGPMGGLRRRRASLAGRREAVDRRPRCGPGCPYFGVCLGAQLLAASLGAQVHPGGGARRSACCRSRSTAEGRADPVLAVLGDEFPALQWHGDTFDIPAGAVRLARVRGLPASGHALRRGRVRGPVPRRGDRRDVRRVGAGARLRGLRRRPCSAPVASASWPEAFAAGREAMAGLRRPDVPQLAATGSAFTVVKQQLTHR